jgi:RHS repeat-associated protein
MHTSPPRRARAAFVLLLVAAQILLGCPPANPPLDPVAGLPERRSRNLVAVPGGFVDVAGGKLLVRRNDLELDTRLGRESIGAVYDAVAGAWRWSFDSRYDGATFVDDTGASFAVAALAPGAAIPGTTWVKLDAARMKTKGGLVHEYGAAGLLAARYWASDPYPRIRQQTASIAGALRISAIEQCTGATSCTPLFTLGYDGSGRLVSVVDRAGRRAEFAWDTVGRLVSARDGLDVAKGWPGFRYDYVGGKLTSLTNSEGEQVVYGYAKTALTTATQVGPGSPQSRFVYEGRDAAGLYHTRSWNPLGEERRHAYDGLGRLVEQEEVASGERTRWTWSGERVTSQILPSGATTTWAWADDDVQVRADPSGNVVSFSYQPGAVDRDNPLMRPIAAVTDSLGLVEARSYDAAGRLVEQQNGAGDQVSFSWAQGALTSETRDGVTRSFSEFGEHGHALRVSAFGVTELRAFDAVGNRVRGSDGRSAAAGGIVERGFDADRNLSTLMLEPLDDASGPLTLQLEYRSDGQRARVRRGGDDHEFGYDAFGRRVEQRERVDGVWQITRFGHDAAGRPTYLERPNGMREELAYGPDGRLASVRRLRAGVLESTLEFDWANGLLQQIDDSESGVEQYAYDAAGRRVATTFADGERLETDYDVRSRSERERFVSAQGDALATLSYQHDLADRRVAIADASGVLQLSNFADGRLAEQRFGNGLVRSFSYRADGLPTGATTTDAAGALVEQSTLETEFEIDPVTSLLRLRQRATTSTFGGVDVLTVEEYVLDPAPGANVIQPGARIQRWNDGLSSGELYRFDALGNLLGFGDTQLSYNAEGNRLLGVSRAGQSIGSYAWDAAGFATARNGAPLAWSAAGRLLAHGADTLEWDGLGRLRAAQVGGSTARFRFGGRVQADAAGTPLAIDMGEVWIGFGGTHRYRHLDFRGNVKFVSDDAGTVLSHVRYAPFGVDAVFGADGDPVRFVARAELGELMLLGARVYDPAVGRFLSPDPLFQVVNQFAYTLGNPVWFSDADGYDAAANDSAQGLADGLAIAGGGLNLLGALLRFAPTPQTVVIGSGLLLLGSILLMLALIIRTQTRSSAGFRAGSAAADSGGASVASGGSGTGTGGAGAGCSPAALTQLPELGGWLRYLLPLQLLLGWCVLRRRREEHES